MSVQRNVPPSKRAPARAKTLALDASKPNTPTKAGNNNRDEANTPTSADMESKQKKSPDDPRKVHYIRRKHAAEDLKKKFEGAMPHNLKGPPLVGAAKPKNGAPAPESDSKPKEKKKILKVFRM
jgi:hypothetical protein